MVESTKLNNQQLDMLRLLENSLPEQDYNEVKRAVVKILARNINSEMGRLENENDWTADTYEDWGKEHSRTTSTG